MNLSLVDILIFIAYAFLVLFVGFFVSTKKKGESSKAADYFMAGNSLPWWIIGPSVLAANISAEQFIGMSGSGYAIGIAIATYEWIAAVILIVVAKYFIPIFLDQHIYTMPQFLEIRYNRSVKTCLAVFWILLFVLVNLTSVSYLGALVLQPLLGIKPVYGIIGLSLFAAFYTIYGGLKAVVWTDVIQVVFLIGGGLVTTVFALKAVGGGAPLYAGLSEMIRQAPEKFHLIIGRTDPNYRYVPGIWILTGGLWVAGFYYFGANQYIIQKALSARNLNEARRGLVCTGFLKLLTPLLVVLPGIAAFILHASIAKPDEAYPWLLNRFVPAGLKGLVLAALTAAILSTLSAIANSASTIFTYDIYKTFIRKSADDKQLIRAGRWAAFAAFSVSAAVAPVLQNLGQAFQFIQKYTGFVSPGVLAVFVFGMFWRKTTSKAALCTAVATIPSAVAIDLLFPGMPFLNKMGLNFLILSLFIVLFSLVEGGGKDDPKALTFSKKLFASDRIFDFSSFVILGILALLYVIFW
jgi:SSS family solute:Na+ symporter